MLYLVATPIGNLNDISKRALETLENADIIACEDTRRTIKLLNHFNIKKKLVSYHEHNKIHSGLQLLEYEKKGLNICLVSDAGCPAISDPGEDLVKLFYENNKKVSVLPGPCAFVSALMISGMDTKKFSFLGFLNGDKGKRKKDLEALKNYSETMILYEAPHKLKRTLKDLEKVFGSERKMSLVREITKIYEQVQIGTIKEIIDIYDKIDPRGEMVLIIEGGVVQEKEKITESIEEEYGRLQKEGLSNKDAMRKIAINRNTSRREVYNYLNRE